MLKVVLLLITFVSEGFAAFSTYIILSGVADACFYFMPIFVAYGAAQKLGGTPIYAMLSAAALLHGNYTALVAAGEPVTMIGLPVRLVSYSSSMLPALLIALAPLGSIIGSYLAQAFIFLGDTVGFIAVGVLAACLPWLVMTGMHAAIAPFYGTGAG